MDLDRPLDDIVRDNKERVSGGNRKRGGHGRVNSFRSAPYQVQRRVSANAVPTAPQADAENHWKHDLFKTVNKTNANGNAANKAKEEVIKFPPRQYTEQEKAKMLQTNPLFRKLDAAVATKSSSPETSSKQEILQFPSPRTQTTLNSPQQQTSVTAPALIKSFSSPQLSTPSIAIAGTASSSVILSNLAPTVSVEDIKATLGNIGGGVREVHIMGTGGRRQGEGLKVKVTFNKPAEGGKECITRFNGVVADGRKISVAFETPDKSTSFLNRRADSITAQQPPPQAPRHPRRNQRQYQHHQQQNNNASAPAEPASNAIVIDGTQGFVPKLYSDVMLIRAGQKKR